MWKVIRASQSRYEVKDNPEGIQGFRRVDESVDNPAWDQVRTLVERLDGARCTDMDIEGPNRYGMAIGGGPDWFSISVIGEDMGPYALVGPDPSDETTKIVIGGQLTDMPRRFLASREQVLQAAEYFFHHGKLDPALEWQLC